MVYEDKGRGVGGEEPIQIEEIIDIITDINDYYNSVIEYELYQTFPLEVRHNGCEMVIVCFNTFEIWCSEEDPRIENYEKYGKFTSLETFIIFRLTKIIEDLNKLSFNLKGEVNED